MSLNVGVIQFHVKTTKIMAKIKTRGITIRRIDKTVPMTEEEQKIAKKLGIEEFRKPRYFRVKINDAIPPTHKGFQGC